jgi:hypothetical protein
MVLAELKSRLIRTGLKYSYLVTKITLYSRFKYGLICMTHDQLDQIAESLGAVHSLLNAISKYEEERITKKVDDEIIVLAEYCLGYVERAFGVLLK